MDTVTRFPRGHRVICAFALSYRDILKEKGVSFTEDDEKIFVECFISGDSAEKGLSMVTLDNPEFCLMHGRDEYLPPIVRESIAQGYYPYWVDKSKKHLYQSLGTGYGKPSCPY